MKKLLFVVLCSLAFMACKKDAYDFPYARVNFEGIYPSNPVYKGLHFPGRSASINGGVNGILLFHDYFDNYTAYDRACTNDPLNSCEQVYRDEENPNVLSCHCCESQYFIFDGSVTKGPAKQALHRYSTRFDGVELRVYN